MQRYTIFFITVNALHVSDGFFANHQELKNGTHNIGCMPSLLAATSSSSSKHWLYLNNTVSMFIYLSHGGKIPVEEDCISKLRIRRRYCVE